MLIDEYLAIVTRLLEKLVASERSGLAKAASWIAEALQQDGIIYATGSGHSHMIAEEVFYRAGGAAPVQAILDPGLMLHQGAQRSTLLERLEAYADIVLGDYPIGPKDVVIIASNSGRNAFPIETALIAKAKGARVIAITSTAHAAEITSRHKNGKLLRDVADLAIDTGAPYGDASLAVPGSEARMGPVSTISGVFIVNAIMAEAVASLAKRGIAIDVYKSANAAGGGDAEAIAKRWRARIRGL